MYVKKGKLLTTLVCVGGLIFLNQQFFQPQAYLDDNQALYYHDEKRIQSHMSEVLPDYLPPGVNYETLTPLENRFEIAANKQAIEPTIDRTHEFVFSLDVDKPTQVNINIFDFPGWQLYLDGLPIEHQVGQDLPIITLDLDPDLLQTTKVTISGVFTETPIRKIANLISIGSIMIISYILLHERHTRSAR